MWGIVVSLPTIIDGLVNGHVTEEVMVVVASGNSAPMERNNEDKKKQGSSSENCNGCCDCYCYPWPMTATGSNPAGDVNPESSGCYLTLCHEISSCLYQMICCPVQAGEVHTAEPDNLQGPGCCCLFQAQNTGLAEPLVEVAADDAACCCDDCSGCDACAGDALCCCPFGDC